MNEDSRNPTISTENLQVDSLSVRRIDAGIYTTSAEGLVRVAPIMTNLQQHNGLLQSPPAASSLVSTNTATVRNLTAEEITANIVIDEHKATTLTQQVQVNANVAYVSTASVITKEISLVADNEDVRTASQLRQRLRSQYQRENTISRICYPNDPLPLEQLYVRLLLISDQENQSKKEQELKRTTAQEREDYLNTFESIHSAKTPINLDSLYRTSLLPRETFRYFIEGRAGIGKSTFLKYIAYRWSLNDGNKLQLWNEQFQWVFLIKLRNLEGYATTANDEDLLLTIIERECLNLGPMESLSDIERKLLKQVLRTEKILWCLDGYDEFNLSNDKRLLQFFNGLFNSTHVILTSRPHQFRSTTKATHLEITGFTLEAMHDYIDKSFATIRDINLGRIRHLKDLIKQDQNLQGIMHVPINLELLCSIWHQKQLDIKSFTITELYKNIIDLLSMRYLEKNDHNTEMLENMLTFLEALAFIGMLEYRIMLTMDDIEKALPLVSLKLNKHQVLQELKRIGLIKPTDNGLHFYFLHLTVQEYLATGFLRKLLTVEVRQKSTDGLLIQPSEFIRKNKYNPLYQVMWWFLAGRLIQTDMLDSKPLQHYFDILCSAPFTLPGVHQLNLIVRCLNEAKLSDAISQKSAVLNCYAGSLKQLIGGHYTSRSSPVVYDSDLKRNNEWLKYFLDILCVCRQTLQTSEMERMFTSGQINLLYFRKVELLSTNTMKNALQDTSDLSAYFLINPKINTDSTIRYKIENPEEILDIVFKAAAHSMYDHIEIIAAHLLCKHINKNPNVIFFLIEIEPQLEGDVKSFESMMLSNIEMEAIYYCEDHDIKLLIKLARVIHSLEERTIQSNILVVWNNIINKEEINHEHLHSLLEITKDNDPNLFLELIKLSGKKSKTPQMIETLIQTLGSQPNPVLQLEVIKILFFWEIYENQIISKFADILRNSDSYKIDAAKELVIQIVESQITGSATIDVIMNFLAKTSAWSLSKNHCLLLLDYLYGALTPVDQQQELLEKLAQSQNQFIARLAKLNLVRTNNNAHMLDHLSEPVDQLRELLERLAQSQNQFIARLAKLNLVRINNNTHMLDHLSEPHEFRSIFFRQNNDMRSLINQFVTDNNPKPLVEYFNNETTLLYLEDGHLCFILDKQFQHLKISESHEKVLVSAFLESSMMPLFLSPIDASRYGCVDKISNPNELRPMTLGELAARSFFTPSSANSRDTEPELLISPSSPRNGTDFH